MSDPLAITVSAISSGSGTSLDVSVYGHQSLMIIELMRALGQQLGVVRVVMRDGRVGEQPENADRDVLPTSRAHKRANSCPIRTPGQRVDLRHSAIQSQSASLRNSALAEPARRLIVD